jgi:hypothetical protein
LEWSAFHRKESACLSRFFAALRRLSVGRAEVPPARGDRPTTAAIEYELIAGEPYALTEEDAAFRCRHRVAV